MTPAQTPSGSLQLRFGYACQNLSIGASTNHTLRLANLHSIERVREVVDRNLGDLERILRWNAAQGILLFRMGQSLIPFASHARFPYNWRAEHGPRLAALGRVARHLGIRLSMHPGQYINPGSPDPMVRERSLAELRWCTALLDCMEQDDGVIVLHVGGVYGDKAEAAARFVCVMQREPELCRYLALEHDERMWNVAEVTSIARLTGVPVIVDTLHHALNPGGYGLNVALDLALGSWTRGRPKVHVSSQAHGRMAGAHATMIDWADARVLWDALHDRQADVMVEAKGKEQAVLALLGASAKSA